MSTQALKEKPSSWKFWTQFPDESDLLSVVESSWDVEAGIVVSLGSNEYELTEPLLIEAWTRRVAGGAELRLRLKTTVATLCGRCLRKLSFPLDEDFAYRFVSHDLQEQGETEDGFFSENDTVILPLARVKGPVDVSDMVWECLIVSLPQYPVCEEACADLDDFAQELDKGDPRLQVLADLLDEGEKS